MTKQEPFLRLHHSPTSPVVRATVIDTTFGSGLTCNSPNEKQCLTSGSTRRVPRLGLRLLSTRLCGTRGLTWAFVAQRHPPYIDDPMVKSAYENLEVDFWAHSGTLGVTEPCLCMFHRDAGIGTPILDSLTELKGATCPSRRTLTFTTGSRKQPIRNLKLMLVADTEDLKVMHISHTADTATIKMTQCGLSLILNAVTSWLAGGEDFGVSPLHASLKPKQLGKLDKESGELWFWGPGYFAP